VKLHQKTNLFVLMLLGGLVIVLVTVGYIAIDRIILQDNVVAFERELDHIDLNIRQNYEELLAADLIGLPSYVEAEKKRVLKLLEHHEHGETGRLQLIKLDNPDANDGASATDIVFDTEAVEYMFEAQTGQLHYEQNGEAFSAVFKISSHWNWLLVLTISDRELFKARDLYLKQALAFSLLAFILAAFFSLGITRSLKRSITPTLECLQKVERGDLNIRISNPGTDEIGSIQTGINAMIDTVAAKTHELETANVSLKTEIDERKKVETALQTEKETSETANRAKSVFLANMSHELRTPLNAILGFSNLMARDPVINSVQQENLKIINNSGEHLLLMINDVLDLSKIEAGRIDLESLAFDLPQLLREIGRMFELRAENARLRFDLELDPDLLPYIKSDVGKLRQILINLLGNALKFTNEGGFSLRARTQAIIGKPGIVNLQLEVQDSGPGIEPEQLEHIFQPFVQAPSVLDSSKGTGLGLAISSSFVEILGGEISVSSEPGKGSLFYVELPVTIAEAEEVAVVEPARSAVQKLEPDQPIWRILVVEDNRENRQLLCTMLMQAGFETRSVENGEEAIAQFEQWRPHYIWMDMQMPVMDGYEATARIRKLPNGDQVKIVAITASAFREQRKSIMEAGCDDVVHKPFKAHEVFDAMERLLGVRYTYEDQSEVLLQRAPTEGLTAEMLTGLSDDQRRALMQAAKILDVTATEEAIERISTEFPDIAKGLNQLVQKFCFDEILELLVETKQVGD